MIVMEIDHSMDGQDPDARPRHVHGEAWQWCNLAVQDVKELRAMSDAEKMHYSTPYILEI